MHMEPRSPSSGKANSFPKCALVIEKQKSKF
jgi:hypothetical protein